MIEITRDIVVNAPKDLAWTLLSKMEDIHKYHPYIKKSPRVTEIEEGEGCGRVCHFKNGMKLTEEVVEWENGNSFAIDIKGMMGVKESQARISFTTLSEEQTKIHFSCTMNPKFGSVGKFMFGTMMKPMMGKMVDSLMEGMHDYVMTHHKELTTV